MENVEFGFVDASEHKNNWMVDFNCVFSSWDGVLRADVFVVFEQGCRQMMMEVTSRVTLMFLVTIPTGNQQLIQGKTGTKVRALLLCGQLP